MINDGDGSNESQTFHAIETGSERARTNKRILKEYLSKMGVKDKEHKRVLRALGFWDNFGK